LGNIECGLFDILIGIFPSIPGINEFVAHQSLHTPDSVIFSRF